MKKMICLKDLCNYLKLSNSEIRKLCYAGNIPCFKIGNRWMFDLIEIDDWVEMSRQENKNNILFL